MASAAAAAADVVGGGVRRRIAMIIIGEQIDVVDVGEMSGHVPSLLPCYIVSGRRR